MMNINIKTLKEKLFVLLAIIMGIYTSILVYGQSIVGINYWDIFVYINNALLFSHINVGSQLNVPPVLSLLTSIPFQMGFISEQSMFVVCGVLFVLLILGIYLIFCERFSPLESFTSSIIFSMLSLVVVWSVNGSTDIPALTFGIWAIYFTICGVKKEFKYYYPAFLCFLLSFFTRYTNGFVLIIMLFYVYMNKDVVLGQINRKDMLKFISFAVVILAFISAVYMSYLHNIPFISQFLEVSSSNSVSSVNVGFELNPWYYIEYLPQLLSSVSVDKYFLNTSSLIHSQYSVYSVFILLFAVIGLLSFLFRLNAKNEEKISYWKIAILVIISLFTIFTYTYVSYIISELLFVLVLLLLYRWLEGNINKIDILMILLLGIYIILYSYHPVKVDRYIIPVFISIIYFMVLGIQTLINKCHINNKKLTAYILIISLIIFIPINTGFMTSLYQENPHTQLEENAAIFLEEYDSNYKNVNISSDRGVAFSWYLKKYIYTTIPRVLKSNNKTLEDSLDNITAKYYIDSTSHLESIHGYHEIYSDENGENKITIYEMDE